MNLKINLDVPDLYFAKWFGDGRHIVLDLLYFIYISLNQEKIQNNYFKNILSNKTKTFTIRERERFHMCEAFCRLGHSRPNQVISNQDQ